MTASSSPSAPGTPSADTTAKAASPLPTTLLGRAWAILCIVVVLLAAFVAPRFAAPEATSTPRDPGIQAPATGPDAATTAPANWSKDMEQAFQKATTTAPNTPMGVEGQQGWWFFGDAVNGDISQAVGRRAYSPAETARVVTAVTTLADGLKARGAGLDIAIAPAKWSVYPEKLPAWTDGMPKTHSVDELLKAQPNGPWIDLRPALRQARTTADTYSPLNSHWTDFGGLVGFEAMYSTLRERHPELAALPKVTVTKVDVGDERNEMEAMVGVKGANPWTKPVLATPPPAYDVIDTSGRRTTKDGGATLDMLEYPLRTEAPTAPNAQRVLFLLDSTSTSLSPYLATTFAHTMMVRHFADEPDKAPGIDALVTDFDPDLVVYVITERHLNAPFLPAPLR